MNICSVIPLMLVIMEHRYQLIGNNLQGTMSSVKKRDDEDIE
jgi:hypothetical protein